MTVKQRLAKRIDWMRKQAQAPGYIPMNEQHAGLIAGHGKTIANRAVDLATKPTLSHVEALIDPASSPKYDVSDSGKAMQPADWRTWVGDNVGKNWNRVKSFAARAAHDLPAGAVSAANIGASALYGLTGYLAHGRSLGDAVGDFNEMREFGNEHLVRPVVNAVNESPLGKYLGGVASNAQSVIDRYENAEAAAAKDWSGRFPELQGQVEAARKRRQQFADSLGWLGLGAGALSAGAGATTSAVAPTVLRAGERLAR